MLSNKNISSGNGQFEINHITPTISTSLPLDTSLPFSASSRASFSTGQDIVFIDTSVADYQSLVAGVSFAEVFTLNSNYDGIEQINQILQGRSSINSVHVVSHGIANGIQLGSTLLDASNLEYYRPQLQQWGSHLSEDGNILLYGCNVAGSGSTDFVQRLSEITKSDIAASTNLTGSSTSGGDWNLEFKVGNIEVELPFAESVLQTYSGILNTGNGLKAQYYNNIDFTDLKFTRTDATVNFNWDGGSPDASIANDTFSVRWTGQVMAKFSENYTFYTTTDDGVRLWVNNQLIVDQYYDQAATEHRGSITLVAGQKYDIRLDYYENRGGAFSSLGWFSASQARQIIPQSQLFSSGPPTASASATGITTPGATNYTFSVTYNDDTAVDVTSLDSNDILVTSSNGFSQLASLVSVDAAGNGAPRTATYRITTPGGSWDTSDNGAYNIALRPNQVQDNNGNFAAAGNIGSFQVSITSVPTGTGTGLMAEYYNNIDFTDLKFTRTDATINFNWDGGSPDASIASDTFSVRWTGQVMARFNENYTFYTTTDDGVRLWVNNQLIIDQYYDQPATEHRGSIALVAGQKYDIRLDYYENRGGAFSSLGWFSASQARQIIPQSQLFSSAPPIIVEPPIDTAPPTATASSSGITTAGATNYTFNVTYTDNTSVDASSLDSNDILVTGPHGFNQIASLVSVNATGNGTPRTATYRITTPGGSWDTSDNGTYNIALRANQVRDTNGNFANNGNIGSFQVNIPTSGGTETGKGLKAEYYDNINFSNLSLVQTDATINFDWGTDSPNPSMGADTFSIRWSGQVMPRFSEAYTFHTTTDDGVRLWINNQLVIDQFIDQAATEYRGTISLVAGQKYDIRMDYYENGGGASARLAWSSVSQIREIIPQSRLFSTVAPPIIALGLTPAPVAENDGTVSVTIVRTGEDLSGTSSIKYSTKRSDATPGKDYTETIGTAIFAPGETTKTITVPVLNDSDSEPDENFTFVIDQPEGALLGTNRTVNVTIEDNDRTYLTFSEPVVNEDAGTATVVVKRGNATNAASVGYTTVDGTAVAGSDYRTLSGTLNFAAGERTKTISVPIINDTVGEPNKTFTLAFSNPNGVTLTNQDKAVISILDDDPGSFIKEVVASGLNRPTFIDWIPTSNGTTMLIAEKSGVVKVMENGNLLSTPFIDISSQVNDAADRGLLSIAVHPDFANNPYVYLLFTYDPPSVYASGNINNPDTLSGPDETGNRPSRLVRVTADRNNNYRTLVLGSEVILLGKNSNWQNTSRPDVNSAGNFEAAPSGIVNSNGQLFANTQDYLNNFDNIVNIQDYLATDSETHSIGTVRFGSDGSLFVSNGDGTSYNRMDPRSMRVQDINNLSGKILRINPNTGEGLTDNPFYDGNPNSNRSKVFNYGLRNPFRMTIDKRTNTPAVGDVGWGIWEEVNAGKAVNFGWPYYEGGSGDNLQQPQYATLPQAQAFYASGAYVKAPIYSYLHAGGGNAVFAGDYYTGNTFPSIYQNALFVGDVAQGTIDALTIDSEGRASSVRRFASGLITPVQIVTGSDSNLYYVSLFGGEIGRWRPA